MPGGVGRRLRVRDDFTARDEGAWLWRVDGRARFDMGGSVLKACVGPTEALYYSNAELTDGEFEGLRWVEGVLKVKARFTGLDTHFGSAGFGFWNHSMRVDESFPAWFILLKPYGRYPLQGLFAQLGNVFTPIKLFKPLSLYKALLTLIPFAAPIRIASSREAAPDLSLSEWVEYAVAWEGGRAEFMVGGDVVAELRVADDVVRRASPLRCRIDLWIDNAVFQPVRGDAGRVFRHVTQEVRRESCVEVDWLEIDGVVT